MYLQPTYNQTKEPLTLILSKLTCAIRKQFKKLIKSKKSPSVYMRASYPLFNLGRDAQCKYNVGQLRDFKFLLNNVSAHEFQTLVIKAMEHFGYEIVSIIDDYHMEVKRDDIVCLVRVKNHDQESDYVSYPDTEKLIIKKQQGNYKAAMLISVDKHSNISRKHCRDNDVFGFQGFDLMHLFDRSGVFAVPGEWI